MGGQLGRRAERGNSWPAANWSWLETACHRWVNTKYSKAN